MKISQYIYIRVCVLGCIMLLCLPSLQAQGVEHRNPKFVAYIQRHYAEALRQMQRYNIPASITMAQGIVETGAGQSTLALEHNNHFGIKCHSSWRGKTAYRTDDRPNECFRSYDSWEDSYEDHSLFLLKPRYSRLFSLPQDDYRGWAMGLQQAGYATNKGYANALIKIVENYELYTLDHGYLPSYIKGGKKHQETSVGRRKHTSQPPTSQPDPNHMRPIYTSYRLLYILANHGDSYESIAQELGVSARKLAKYNETPLDYPLQEGDVIYLERKHSRADSTYTSHVVRVGDSMHRIAQRYGIRLEKLYQLNQKDEDYTPQEGDILLLR